MEKLESMEIELFRTDKQGTIVGTSNGKEIKWNTEPSNDYSPGVLEDEKVEKETEPQKIEKVTTVEENATEEIKPEVQTIPEVEIESQTVIVAQSTTPENEVIEQEVPQSSTIIENSSGGMVWLSATGEKYHSINDCGRMNPSKARQVTLDYAVSNGYQACSKCY